MGQHSPEAAMVVAMAGATVTVVEMAMAATEVAGATVAGTAMAAAMEMVGATQGAGTVVARPEGAQETATAEAMGILMAVDAAVGTVTPVATETAVATPEVGTAVARRAVGETATMEGTANLMAADVVAGLEVLATVAGGAAAQVTGMAMVVAEATPTRAGLAAL